MNSRKRAKLENYLEKLHPTTSVGLLDMRYSTNRVFGRNKDGRMDGRTMETKAYLLGKPIRSRVRPKKVIDPYGYNVWIADGPTLTD